MKLKFLVVLLLLFPALFFLTSCQKTITDPDSKSIGLTENNGYSKKTKGNQLSTNSINYRYEALSNFKIGIWPQNWTNPAYLSKLKSIYGFNQILIEPTPSDYNSVINSTVGFQNNEIMALWWNQTDYLWTLNTGISKVYVDEPDHLYYLSNLYDYQPLCINNAYNLAHNTPTYSYLNAQVYIGFIPWWDEPSKKGSNKENNYLYFNDYKPWGDHFAFSGKDFTQYAQEWVNLFGPKFSLVWMYPILQTNTEMTSILSSAKTTYGMTEVWLYDYESEGDFVNISRFCEAAVAAGYMRRIAIN